MAEPMTAGTAPIGAVVIGAGPAGLAAAAELVCAGTHVTLVDGSPRFGGQYWRHGAADDSPSAPSPRWHHGWSTYRELRDTLLGAEHAGHLTHLPSTHVWALDHGHAGGFDVHVAPTSEAVGPQDLCTIAAERVVLCPGAYDRQLPVPGWTLPGVMSAGSVQAFIKTQRRSPGQRVLLAGTGPFLMAAAATVLQTGARVAAICESTDLTGWLPGGASAALVPSKIAEGAQYTSLLARHRVPFLRRHAVTEIRGEDRVRAVEVSRVDAAGAVVAGSARVLDDIDVVGLGWGFVPQTELLMQTGAETRLDGDGSLVGVVDGSQESSIPGLFLAGEITGVTGAAGAVAEGRVAGRAAAQSGTARRRDAAARARHRTFAGAMHHAHPVPRRWEDWMRDETVVCRCEEVTYEEVTTARDDLALADPRSVKGSTRAGMGMCQGRICGFAMACLSSQSAARSDGDHAAARQVSNRPFAMPLSLGALAAEHTDGEQPGSASSR